MKKIESEKFAISHKNLKLILIGLGLMLLGYILMIGGGTDDPNIFTGEAMFSFRRLVISPLLILSGIVVEIVAIMYRPKAK